MPAAIYDFYMSGDKPPSAPKLHKDDITAQECVCGCGEQAFLEAEAEAIMLRSCLRLEEKLVRITQAGGRRAKQAAHLLWTWERAKEPLDAAAHGRPSVSPLGPPQPTALIEWRKRASSL